VADIERRRTIAASPEAIWDVLADFGALSSWAANIDHSCILVQGTEPLGTTRRIQVGRDTLVERIVEFEPPHALAYEIQGLPRRLRAVTNRWTLQPAGDSTVVTLTSIVEIGPRSSQQLAERALCRVLARQSDAMLSGLAKRMENTRV
jgi:uncharacterized protein YndB with AHSA1/START domain